MIISPLCARRSAAVAFFIRRSGFPLPPLHIPHGLDAFAALRAAVALFLFSIWVPITTSYLPTRARRAAPPWLFLFDVRGAQNHLFISPRSVNAFSAARAIFIPDFVSRWSPLCVFDMPRRAAQIYARYALPANSVTYQLRASNHSRMDILPLVLAALI
ncbi:hypothetical protein C8J57DRAFT_1543119 [Mycena rebaudengoi]|nr:hypothetical protein C8J57DRAFT_1543119 [Mycena rebaudengoi]